MNKNRSLASILLLAILTASLQAAAADNLDLLRFKNGDSLRGTFQTIDTNAGVRWRRTDAAQPMDFTLTNLSGIVFLRTSAPPALAPNACRVLLNNLDTIEGSLISCDSQALHLNTSCAGMLVIPRNRVQSITMNTAIFDGPTNIDGWTLGKISAVPDSGQWSYRSGAFYASKPASIARKFDLPEIASIQFDLAWHGALNAAVALCANTLQPVSLQSKENEPHFGGFYSFQINNSFFDLLAITQSAPHRYLGALNFPPLAQTNRIHLDFRINKPRSSVALLIDGSIVKEWIDPQGFIGAGTVLRFVHQGAGTLKLSNLRITPWTGTLEKTPLGLTRDAVLLTDDTLLVGKLQSLADGRLTLLATQALAIPISRLQELYFATNALEKPAPSPGAIRAFFGRTGRLTVQLEKWDQNALVVTHPSLGKITINPSALTSLQFTP